MELSGLSKEEEDFIKTVLGNHNLNELEARLKPWKYSTVGFLGENDSLVQTVLEDRATLKGFGITYNQVADRVKEFLDEVSEGFWKPEIKEVDGEIGTGRVYEDLIVTILGTNGYQWCPWGCPMREGYISSSMIVTEHVKSWDKSQQVLREVNENYIRLPVEERRKIRTEHTIKIKYNMILTEMSPHLIRDHKFFEGKGSPYRMEPKTLIEWLGLG